MSSDGMIFGENPITHLVRVDTGRHLRLCNVTGCVTKREGTMVLPNGSTFNLCEKHLARACRAVGLTRSEVMP